jgi:predicted DNA-binding protein with PD1-like motif
VTMRSIRHPGPVQAERVAAAPCTARAVRVSLKPGRSVNDAAAEALASVGARSGYIRLRNARVAPMRYVIPAASPDGAHAAWYSDTFTPAGTTLIEDAGMVVGLRDGEPFLHCHGRWRTADGALRMGHLLPLESELAEAVEAEACAISGALFDVRDDEETNFRLFRAVDDGGAGPGAGALALTVRPNQDVTLAVEDACRAHGIADADIHGIGSVIEADFEDGSRLPSYATEALVRSGRLDEGRASLDIALVGLDGTIGEGRLARGVNPVCVTFELLIVAR